MTLDQLVRDANELTNYLKEMFNQEKIFILDDESVRSINLINHIGKVDVPVYFLLGRNDFDTPSSLAEDYYNAIDAPYKELIWFEESAHFPFYEESAKFNKILLDRAKRDHIKDIP